MCVDAFANIEKFDPRETPDEIDCLEMSRHSDNLNYNSTSCFLNIDLVDEIHCQELKGRKKPRTRVRSPQKIRRNKKLTQTSQGVTNEEKRLSQSIKGKSLGKAKKGKQRNTRKRTNQIQQPRKTVAQTPSSAYRDPKLCLMPDTNPYSKKFLFNTRTRVRPSPVPASAKSLLELKTTNLAASLSEPYCSICQMLLEPEARLELAETEVGGEHKVPAQSAVWLPGLAHSTVSPLLVCTSCNLCVHQACYPTSSSSSLLSSSWECDGCQTRRRTGLESRCCLCQGTGGALAATTDLRLVHLTCALLLPEVGLGQPGGLEVREIPAKRSSVECLLCGSAGRPAVHCQASPGCSLAFHTDCALQEQVDIVLGQITCQYFSLLNVS